MYVCWEANEPVIIFATVALGRERSSSTGGSPECPSRSDMLSRRRTNYTGETNALLLYSNKYNKKLTNFGSPRSCPCFRAKQSWAPYVFRLFLALYCFGFIIILGRTCQSEAFSAGVDRETGVCAPEMGARIQRVPRQHGRLHEPSGMSLNLFFFALSLSQNIAPSLPTPKSFKTAKRTGLWERSSSGTIGCDLSLPMTTLTRLLLHRCNNVLYIISSLPSNLLHVFLLRTLFLQRGSA